MHTHMQYWHNAEVLLPLCFFSDFGRTVICSASGGRSEGFPTPQLCYPISDVSAACLIAGVCGTDCAGPYACPGWLCGPGFGFVGSVGPICSGAGLTSVALCHRVLRFVHFSLEHSLVVAVRMGLAVCGLALLCCIIPCSHTGVKKRPLHEFLKKKITHIFKDNPYF